MGWPTSTLLGPRRNRWRNFRFLIFFLFSRQDRMEPNFRGVRNGAYVRCMLLQFWDAYVVFSVFVRLILRRMWKNIHKSRGKQNLNGNKCWRFFFFFFYFRKYWSVIRWITKNYVFLLCVKYIFSTCDLLVSQQMLIFVSRARKQCTTYARPKCPLASVSLYSVSKLRLLFIALTQKKYCVHQFCFIVYFVSHFFKQEDDFLFQNLQT